MADNKDYITHIEEKGSINVSEDVVALKASAAALEVEGVESLSSTKADDKKIGKKAAAKSVKINVEENKLYLDVYIIAKLNYPINEVALKVQEAVVSSVESTTGFEVATANIHVSGIALK